MPISKPLPLYGEHLESLSHPPSTVLLLRTPVSPAEGTDPYHDAFGSFCLPGFEISALESGSSTPITLSPSNALRPLSGIPSSISQAPNHQDSLPPEPSALHDALSNHTKSSNNSSSSNSKASTGLTSISSSSEKEKRKGRWITDEGLLTTHHLSWSIDPDNPDGEEIEREYCVSSIPILSHCTTNVDSLARKLVYGSESRTEEQDQEEDKENRNGNRKESPYRGIIVCSQRAVEAISASIPLAVEMLCKEVPKGESAGHLLQNGGITRDKGDIEEGNEGKKRGNRLPLTSWPTTPVFAVGPATQNALQGVADSLVYSSDQDSRLIRALAPSIILGGAETGNAEALGQFILKHFKELERRSVVSNSSNPQDSNQNGEVSTNAIHPDAPILLLQGDKSLGTLPKLLSSADPPIPIDIIKCYETCAHERFSESCSRLSRTLALARKSASRRGSGSGLHHQAAAAAAVQSSLAQAVGADFALPAQRDSHITPSLANRSRRGSNQSSITAAARAELGMGLTPLPPQQSGNSSSSNTTTFSLNVSGTGSRFSSSDSSALIIPSESDRPKPPRPDWIVFFSPSGVQYSLNELRSRGWFPPASIPPEQGSVESRLVQMVSPAPMEFPRIAVLGPTTKKYLRDELNLAPDAVAAVPGPSELREAIRMAEKRIAKDKKREEARLIWAENRKRSAIAKAREMELATIEANMIAKVRNGNGNGNEVEPRNEEGIQQQ